MNYTKRQEEIIDAALCITARGGIQSLTVKGISEAMGFSEPAVYRHFANKSEIVRGMLQRFDNSMPSSGAEGINAVELFIEMRIEQVLKNPDLAIVMFGEEMFMDAPEYRAALMRMSERHKTLLCNHFKYAIEHGEIRGDIELDILFRIVAAPVRLMIKQWGLSGQAFDLRSKGKSLVDALKKMLAPLIPAIDMESGRQAKAADASNDNQQEKQR